MATGRQQSPVPSNESPFVTIPDCEASQLVGEDVISLGTGDLSLYAAPSVASMVLFFIATRYFATSAIITPATQPLASKRHIENIGSGSYIRLTLPEGPLRDPTPGNSLKKLRDEFEDALISHGFLKGQEARTYSEDLGRIIREAAENAVNSVRNRTALCVTRVSYLTGTIGTYIS
ncbi:uncharacterized protein EI90DRAFT_515768 [Cantharellus anzutake]|uniref:uncharacterized protein n=1 Tax=Cantharellus anzutake TaxID=1750568 RepID=UPI0019075B84|nr:uncharacterized protein EI90DRAFT_515768 [Cantharellus anzutake]KAF8334166.1 hypothetical protein EI90DRAFT_515768 [Cantharellus anzutake]